MHFDSSFTFSTDTHAALRLVAQAIGENPDILADKIVREHLEKSCPDAFIFLTDAKEQRKKAMLNIKQNYDKKT